MKESILIIDDDIAIRDGCAQVLKRRGFEVSEAATGRDAATLLDQYEYDLILLDLKMPDINGLDLLRNIREKDQIVPVIIITAYGTIQNAVEAMRLGANDFLPKPFEPDELHITVQRNLKARQLAMENLFLKEELRRKDGDVRIIGKSKVMKTLFEQIVRVAPTDSTVIITGESGTGKGLIARRIHELSPRREYPFVSVDCSTLVPSLFESEMFGHVRGAFTGAEMNKIGKFEIANHGTLFLDEIANIGFDRQAKLLKAVEEKEISRVGSNRLTKVDVRIIAATNQDLKQAVQNGTFREDLYFRLNVVAIKAPPLRERKDDIPLLAEYFLEKFGEKHRRNGLFLTHEAIELLSRYQWPGNVRELENSIERLVIFANKNPIDIDDIKLIGLPFATDGHEAISAARYSHKTGYAVDDGLYGTYELLPLDEIERRYVIKVLEEKKGNRTEAARILGIDRKTLRQKLKRWGMELDFA
ncbi:MAG: sigma-54-dependent transcriptional regulator [Dissulfurimicrobium sp.]|uniref:sigma-54-dependent transcriptional regulator n=1 Tax=Dissulfurimicrobium sp. TaxID=2022436 RepID=UPI00404B6801